MTAYRNGDMGLNQCAKQYGVPKATLKRHLDGKNKTANGHRKLGRSTMLTSDLEEQLHDHILHMEGMFFGMTRKDLMALAFEVAEENGLDHPFNREKRIAGKGWYYNFLKRFPDISLRQPEATSLSRATGFNRDAVSRYFDLLEDVIRKHNLTANRIFNVDESGITTVQKKCQKILGQRGKKQLESVSSAERGVTTTVKRCLLCECLRFTVYPSPPPPPPRRPHDHFPEETIATRVERRCTKREPRNLHGQRVD